MTPTRRRWCLDQLHWSQRGLADILGWAEGTVRGWMRGNQEAPPEVDEWLERRAMAMEADPPPVRNRGAAE
jgi:transcriptional regulator with XRE-family HTH domain